MRLELLQSTWTAPHPWSLLSSYLLFFCFRPVQNYLLINSTTKVKLVVCLESTLKSSAEERGKVEKCVENSVVSLWCADLMATAWNCQLPKVQRSFRAIWHHTGVCSHHSGSIASCTAQVSSISFNPLINIYQLPTGAGLGQWPGWLSWGFIKRCSKHGYIWDGHLHPHISPLFSPWHPLSVLREPNVVYFKKTHGRNLKCNNQIIKISKEAEVNHSEAILLASSFFFF